MNCEQLASKVTDLMEGELTEQDEQAALEHLATCTQCETVLAQTQDAVKLVSAHGSKEIAPEQSSRLLEEIKRHIGDS